MSKEKLHSHSESKANKISSSEAEQQLENIRQKLEKEVSHEHRIDTNELSSKVEKLAQSSESISGSTERESEVRDNHNPVYDRNESFKTTIGSVKKELSRGQQVFSAVIHNRVVERTSEIADRTVARPSVLLGGFSFSAIGSLVVYVIARQNGYAINSHFIVLALLIIGAVSGLGFELLYKLLRFVKQKI